MKAVDHGDHWEAKFEIPWKNIRLCNGTFRFALVRLFIRQNACEYSPCPDIPGGTVFRLRIGYHLPQYMMTFKVNFGPREGECPETRFSVHHGKTGIRPMRRRRREDGTWA